MFSLPRLFIYINLLKGIGVLPLFILVLTKYCHLFILCNQHRFHISGQDGVKAEEGEEAPEESAAHPDVAAQRGEEGEGGVLQPLPHLLHLPAEAEDYLGEETAL